jgi:hypothetical protein
MTDSDPTVLGTNPTLLGKTTHQWCNPNNWGTTPISVGTKYIILNASPIMVGTTPYYNESTHNCVGYISYYGGFGAHCVGYRANNIGYMPTYKPIYGWLCSLDIEIYIINKLHPPKSNECQFMGKNDFIGGHFEFILNRTIQMQLFRYNCIK